MQTRLRELRKRAGMTLDEVAERLGISTAQVSRLERGTSDLSGERLGQFAVLYGTTVADLLVSRPALVPLVGYIGAGAEVYPFDGASLGGDLDQVETPPHESRALVAVEVRGDSMFPAYREGDLIYYARDGAVVNETAIGAECVVKIADGPTLVKTLMRGSQASLWTLLSYNAPPLENVAIEWAAPVLWVDKRRKTV
jgi:transcriptional regulator with XRE-family HTH domain